MGRQVSNNLKKENKFSIVFVPSLACDCTCDHCFSAVRSDRVDEDFWHLFLSRLKQFKDRNAISRLVFYWLGGELLCLPPEFFKDAFTRFEGTFGGEDTIVEHHLQSNLIGFDPTWRQIVANYFGNKISTSLDFPNLYRKTAVIKLKAYNEYWIGKKNEVEAAGIEVSVISLPNAETLEKGASAFYHYFRDHAAISKLQVNLPFVSQNVKCPIELDLAKLGAFMEDLYHLWVADGRKFDLAPFSTLERTLIKGKQNLSCIFSYNCGEKLFSVAPNGEVVPCDYWVTNPDRISYGNLADASIEKILKSESRHRFMKRPLKLLMQTECGNCPYWSICHGGCPIRALCYAGTLYAKDRYCAVYKRLFGAILETGVQLA
jgi:radical SAM protein with 4Fe4S-binding SPASM domain